MARRPRTLMQWLIHAHSTLRPVAGPPRKQGGDVFGPLWGVIASIRADSIVVKKGVEPGLYPIIGGSGGGKSVVAGAIAGALNVPIFQLAEPGGDWDAPLSASRLVELVSGVDGGPADAGNADDEYMSPEAEALAKNLAEAYTKDMTRQDEKPWGPGVHVVDGLTPFLYELGGAAAEGGYSRELTYALLALNQICRARSIFLLATFNPFSGSDKAKEMVWKMVEGSTAGVVEVVDSRIPPRATSDRARGGLREVTFNCSLRPDLRGPDSVNNIRAILKVANPEEK